MHLCVPVLAISGPAALPLLADQVPFQETARERDPDLVYAGWESNFSADIAAELALSDTLIRRGAKPLSAVEVILRPATTVNSSLDCHQ